MEHSKSRFSIGKKMYVFIIATVLFAVACVCAITFLINVNQIDRYFKRLTINNAKNIASFVDADFLVKLRKVAESDEYQAIRDAAEEADDDEPVIEYLKEQGLWEQYEEQRDLLRIYVGNLEDIEYLYLVVWGDIGTNLDMYLLDADDVPVYETGYYEVREAEFEGVDPNGAIEPVISKGDWGWLCSGYYPIYDDAGNIICHAGCDVQMDVVMKERRNNLISMIGSAVVLTAIVLVGAIIFINKTVISPMNRLTKEMKKFAPEGKHTYEDAHVIDIQIESRDEIEDIYEEVHLMQTRIIDYINDISMIEQDKQKAEDDVKIKEKEIGLISKEAYKDSLTGIGNKTAYLRKEEEINSALKGGMREFAIVMVDINNLKHVNDTYGHSNGDLYIRGCCHIICEVFKHSPVYRIGGDEFVVLLTGEDYEHRDERMNQIRTAYENALNEGSSQPWERYSAAVGMADYSEKDVSMEFVFKRADKRMYEEKQAFKQKNGTANRES